MTPAPDELRAFTKMLAQAFADNTAKSFGVIEADGILVAIAKADSGTGKMLRAFVTDEWHARIDTPKLQA